MIDPRMRALIAGLILTAAACTAAPAASPAAQAPAPISWSQFQDPIEHAFTVDVPKGWTAKGGLFRLGYSDERGMVDLRSPDGAVEIRLGDVSIPSYAVPNQFHAREGEVYDLGAQAQLIVARYRTGPEFAVLYSHARFGSACHNPQPDQDDAGFTIPDYVPSQDAVQSSGGQIAWRCETQAGPRVIYAYTKTALGQGVWQVPAIVSFVAPPAQSAAARTVALHCAQTFKLSPAWIAYQKQMDAEGMQYQQLRQQGRLQQLQAQVQQFQAQMQAMQAQVNAFEQHQAAQASQVQSFTNALNGITPTTDPLTGEQRDVWSGPYANYWVNGQGVVVNSTSAPAAGWRQLQPNP